MLPVHSLRPMEAMGLCVPERSLCPLFCRTAQALVSVPFHLGLVLVSLGFSLGQFFLTVTLPLRQDLGFVNLGQLSVERVFPLFLSQGRLLGLWHCQD